MDGLLRSSKFIDLKKSFSSLQNNHGNNSYGQRSVSRTNNSRRQSVYSKFSNRNYGNSEVGRELSIPLGNSESVSQLALQRNNESINSKADKCIKLNGNSSVFKERDNLDQCSGSNHNKIPTSEPVDSSFRFHYSESSPIKSNHEISERNGYNRPKVPNMRMPPDVHRVERDNEGFIIPTAIHRPKPRVAEINEEEERLTQALLSELIDSITPVEAFYYLKRYEEWLVHEKRKKAQDIFNGFRGLDKDKSLRIVDWLQSNACEPPNMVTRGWNRETADDFISVSSRNEMHHQFNSWHRYKEKGPPHVAVFLLKNWTIIKGIGPMDLMVSGDLRDMKDQTLIEEGHVTSRILSADATIIKTSCCVYHLIGEFSDTNNNIPEDIRKHFVSGKFPNQWKEIVRKWNLIKQKQSMECFSNGNNTSVYGETDKMNTLNSNRKRKALENPKIEMQRQLELKKSRTEPPDIMIQTPMARKTSNFSMITRSALRKRQSRVDYSFLGTPKSSKVYNKLKSRIKTPMPRRGRENQVKEVRVIMERLPMQQSYGQ